LKVFDNKIFLGSLGFLS